MSKEQRAKERDREEQKRGSREGAERRERERAGEPDKPRVRARSWLQPLCLLYDASLLELRVGLASWL